MARYRKKPVVVEATQWFRMGNHPAVESFFDARGAAFTPCRQCAGDMGLHGWVKTLEGGHIVCPGDWIITGTAGEVYPCKDKIFREIYEPVQESAK